MTQSSLVEFDLHISVTVNTDAQRDQVEQAADAGALDDVVKAGILRILAGTDLQRVDAFVASGRPIQWGAESEVQP